MVGQAPGIRLIVIEHTAILVHPGDADLAAAKTGHLPCLPEFLALAQQLGGLPQIPAHLLAEQIVVDHGHRRGGEHQGYQGDEAQTQIDLLLHTVPSGALRST